MGHRVTQTVNISGGGGSDALVPVLAVLVVAYVGATVVSALVAALEILLIWLLVVGSAAVVLAVVLCIVFRRQLGAYLGGPALVYRAAPEPERLTEPKQELHLHFHGDSEVDKAMLALRVASSRADRAISPATFCCNAYSSSISKCGAGLKTIFCILCRYSDEAISPLPFPNRKIISPSALKSSVILFFTLSSKPTIPMVGVG